jgi:hypothetical protein
MITQSLVDAVIRAESNGNPRARSSKGAQGLMQIMPETFNQYADRGMNPYNPEHSRIVGTRYLSDLNNRYGGDTKAVLAAYNGGPTRFDRNGRDIRKMPRETQNYVQKVLNPISNANADETPYQENDLVPYTGDYETSGKDTQQDSDLVPYTGDYETNDTHPGVMSQAQDAQPGVLSQANPDIGFEGNNWPNVIRKANVAARGVVEGVAGLPGEAINLANRIPNAFGANIQPVDTEQYGTKLADAFGAAKPNENDTVIYPVSKGVGSFIVPVGAAAKLGSAGGKIARIGEALGGNAIPQSIAGMVTGKAASEGAKRYGAPPSVQMAADIAGNIAGGQAPKVIGAVARGSGRVAGGALGAKKSLEGVAGRALNKAAGEESPYIASILDIGKVPTVKIPIRGVQPTTSDIAANPGIATILRNNKLHADNLTELGNRDFSNMEAVKNYALKAVGDKAKIKGLQTETKALEQSALAPMRERNQIVSTESIKKTLDDAIAKHEGNSEIVKHLQYFRRKIGDATELPFNNMVNIKQELDQKLRAKAFGDPEIASFQRAKSALDGFKSSMTEALTSVEPEFRGYATDMSRLMRKIDNAKAGQKMVNKSLANNAIVSNVGAVQREIKPLSAAQLNQKLNSDAAKGLNPTQAKRLAISQEHAALPNRRQAGSMVGSSTAQNLSVKEQLLEDAIQGMNTKKGGGAVSSLAALGANLSGVNRGLTAAGMLHGKALSAILTKAELEPAYAAKLMKTYGLGEMSFSDPSGRAALRALLSRQNNQ